MGVCVYTHTYTCTVQCVKDIMQMQRLLINFNDIICTEALSI